MQDITDLLRAWGPMNETAQRAIVEIERLRRRVATSQGFLGETHQEVPGGGQDEETSGPALEDIRRDIDGFDREICLLLELRAASVRWIQTYKSSSGIPVRDLAREKRVFKTFQELTPSLTSEDAHAIIERIVDACVEAADQSRGDVSSAPDHGDGDVWVEHETTGLAPSV